MAVDAGKPKFDDDESEETMEFLAMLQPRSGNADNGAKSSEAKNSETSGGSASSSGNLSTSAAEDLRGDFQQLAKRFCSAGLEQLAVIKRTAEARAGDLVKWRPGRSSCCRCWVLLLKIVIVVVIAVCAVLIPLELAWRLGPEPEDFY